MAGDWPERYTCLDLFAGAGGFALGAEAAGFRCVGAVEIDDVAGRTFSTNFGPVPLAFLGSSEGDITSIVRSDLKARLSSEGIDELDLLIACPPCQGFSRIGRGKLDSLADAPGAFAGDKRNFLYRQAVETLCVLRPRAFVFENVTGILHLRGRNAAEDVCQEIEEAGYRVRCAILNAAWYGVPQIRERVVIVALRADLAMEPSMPRRTHYVRRSRGLLSFAALSPATWRESARFVPWRDLHASPTLASAVTTSEAFGDLPAFRDHLVARANGSRYRSRREDFPPVPYASEPRNGYTWRMRNWPGLRSESVSDHFCRWTPRDFEIFQRLRPGDRYPEAHEISLGLYRAAVEQARQVGGTLPDERDFVPPYPLDGFDDRWRKLLPDQPSWTVTAHLAKDTYSHIHFDSSQARAITPREAARLQSFPDAFGFAGNTGDVFRQIGNAVPPILAEAISASIRRSLKTADMLKSALGPGR